MSVMTTTVAAALFAFPGSAASFITFQGPGCAATVPMAINDRGEVVGTCG